MGYAIFHRVFDGDETTGFAVYVRDQAVYRRGFPGSSRPYYQDEPLRFRARDADGIQRLEGRQVDRCTVTEDVLAPDPAKGPRGEAR